MTASDRFAEASVDALTLDGRIVRIRPVRPTDAPALTALYDTADTRTLQSRFFSLRDDTVRREVARLTRPVCDDFAALVAVEGQEIMGVASYERGDASPARGDVAVFVAAAHQGHGIATLLLERLCVVAYHRGLTRLAGKVLASNLAMLRVVMGLSPDGLAPAIGKVVDVELPVVLGERDLIGAGDRHRTARRWSLAALMNPRVVAVACGDPAPGRIGHEVVKQILERDFTGRVYPVHRHAGEVAGQRGYPSFEDIPESVDLVVIAVPADEVAEVIDAAGRAGARAAVVLSEGFTEAGPAGAQRQLVRGARRHHMRLLGPDTLGVINTDPQVRLAASLAIDVPLPGGLALASQSKAVGIAMLRQAVRADLGVRSFVSLGDKADISGNDLLAYWYDDPGCQAVALYLESFGNPRNFARSARAFARNKPILAVKSRRPVGYPRSGMSHTATAATSPDTMESLFAQTGVIRTDTLSELLDAARLLTGQPLPTGKRVAIVGNSGGVNTQAADSAAAAGLALPIPSQPLTDRLLATASGAVALDNPIDLGTNATPAAFGAAITSLADSAEVDALVAIFAASRSSDVSGSLDAITTAIDTAPELPMAVVLVGVPEPPATLGKRRVPVFDLPEPALAALGRAVDYAAWRREPLGRRPDLPNVDHTRARSLLDDALREGGGWQGAAWSFALLDAYGIARAPSYFATSVGQAIDAATHTGFPVALKTDDVRLFHKTEYKAVHLNLETPAAIKNAYLAIGEAVGTSAPRVVVQPMRSAAVELIAGIVHDRLFGSTVMLGMGGIHTDLFDDHVFRLLPMTDADARRMWRSLRTAPLLTGHRGSTPVDTDALEDMLLRLARLAEDFPEIAELDINPVMAGPGSVTAVGVRIRVAAIGSELDSTVSTLRPA